MVGKDDADLCAVSFSMVERKGQLEGCNLQQQQECLKL